MVFRPCGSSCGYGKAADLKNRSALPLKPGATRERRRAGAGRTVSVPVEGGDNLLGGALLHFPQEAGGGCGGLGSNQEVKVLGHQHPAEEME
jgi:hypothetical protein